jgi:hypothetical protein
MVPTSHAASVCLFVCLFALSFACLFACLFVCFFVCLLQSGDGEVELKFFMTPGLCQDASYFEVVAVLGSGSFGVVFQVKCTHPETPCPDKVRAAPVRLFC